MEISHSVHLNLHDLLFIVFQDHQPEQERGVGIHLLPVLVLIGRLLELFRLFTQTLQSIEKGVEVSLDSSELELLYDDGLVDLLPPRIHYFGFLGI